MAPAKDDLTGAALISLMRLSFAEQKLDLTGIAAPSLPTHLAPHASLSAKTALAEAVLARHGPMALINVGRSVRRMAFDPIGAALLAAGTGRDLIQRWLRLVRYVHTRHPILVRELTDQAAVLDHSGDSDDPPSPANDLVLAGVIHGLLLAIGCRAVELTIDEAGAAWTPQLSPIVPPGTRTGLWVYRWIDPSRRSAPEGPPTDNDKTMLIRRIRHLVGADLFRRWTLTSIASELAVSARTLQRRLGEENLSLQALILDLRVQRATEMLVSSDASLSVIGFHCGFADTAHFCRVFKLRAGMTPGAYRAALGR